MLIIQFSVAVEYNRADEVRDRLMEDYGVVITKETLYEEKLCWNEPTARIYMDCFVPFGQFDYVTAYLNNIFDGTAILTY